MGLDNGLRIKGKSVAGKVFLNKHCKDMKDENSFTWYDFGYWRKCWSLRDRFLDVFKDKGYDGSGGEFTLTIADLIDVVENVMKFFLEDEDRWSEYGNGFTTGSIWAWHEGLRSIVNCIYNIREFLEDYQIENADGADLSDDDFMIEFYDSY